MKKLTCILTVLGIGIFSLSTAHAEGLGVFGSYWDPSDGDETLGAGVRLRGGDGPFYLQLRGTFFEDITEDRGLIENDLEVIPADFGFGLQAHADENLTLYGGGGLSYYFLDSDHGDLDDEVGWYLEAGTELGITEYLGIFIEGVWRRVEGSVDDDNDLVDDTTIDLEGVSVNVGLLFRW